MNNLIVSCFHFNLNVDLPFEFNGEDYIQKLTTALNKFETITNLNIKADDDFKSTVFKIDEELGTLDDGDFNFPVGIEYIKFDIKIPLRVQRGYLNDFESKFHKEVDVFKVMIIYGYHYPVAFIYGGQHDSNSAVIVREYLRDKVNQLDLPIRFECLGPSPFPKIFILNPIDKGDNSLSDRNPIAIDNRGSIVFINYWDGLSNDESEVINFISLLIKDIFGYYYQSMGVRLKKILWWNEIDNKCEKLREYNGSWMFKFKKRETVSKIIFDLTEFEIYSIRSLELLNNLSRGLLMRSSHYENKFKEIIDIQLEENLTFPVEQTMRLLNFIENQNSKYAARKNNIIAALLGSIITILLGGLIE